LNYRINIYTDGARKGRDEYYGGWGTILENGDTKETKELSGGLSGASNNQMELTSVIEGLKAIKVRNVNVYVFSDSAYIVNCFREKWYEKWIREGWINSKKEPVKNRGMWEELLGLVRKFTSVTFLHIDGHINVKNVESTAVYRIAFNRKNDVDYTEQEFIHVVEKNTRADKLAGEGAKEIMNKG
jgi:ribonuclease HI